MTHPCIVCHCNSDYHLQTKCCSQYICEKCFYHDMRELCPICDRTEINNKNCFCESCEACIPRLNYRTCLACEHECCVECAVQLNCCDFNDTGDCKCALCAKCQFVFEDSKHDNVDKFILDVNNCRECSQSDESSEEGYSIHSNNSDVSSECSDISQLYDDI